MNGTNLYTTDVNAQTDFCPATIEEIMTGARQALSNRDIEREDVHALSRAGVPGQDIS